jgi:agmatinase
MAAKPKTFGDIPNPPRGQATVAVLRAYEKKPRGSALDGPGSIVAASAYMELYDEELDVQPSDLGLHTVAEPLDLSGDDRAAVRRIATILHEGLFPVVIGDKRRLSTVSMGAVLEQDPAASPVVLAGSLPPEDFWRALDALPWRTPVRIIGLKSIPRLFPSRAFLMSPARRLAEDADDDPWHGLGETVHLSIHPDFLEPAFLPGPANIEPGGLDWWRAVRLLRQLFADRRVLGMDLSGHVPEKGKVVADFTLAKLIYKAIGYRLCLRGRNGAAR